jgi:hypothetical protein
LTVTIAIDTLERMAEGSNGRLRDPGVGAILSEIRDLRREARDDRRRSDERFEALLVAFRQDSARREAATQKVLEATQAAFRDLRSVGLSIVKTLNRHTTLLERIDRKLGARDHGRPENGRER